MYVLLTFLLDLNCGPFVGWTTINIKFGSMIIIHFGPSEYIAAFGNVQSARKPYIGF